VKTKREFTCGRASRLLAATVILAVLVPWGCAKRQVRQVAAPEKSSGLVPSTRSPYLKAHMNKGNVYVLQDWQIDQISRSVTGAGQLLDLNRRLIASDTFHFAFDSVALFETNQVSVSPAVAALSVITGLSIGGTILCIANPKSCFGSCPTFYVTDGHGPLLQAEGFSASIAPFLEATDIDALFRAAPRGRQVNITMTNEAYETHVVRRADLLIAKRSPAGRVLVDRDGRFWRVGPFVEPSSCLAPEGDCTEQVEHFDGRERFSLSDSTDLAAKETLELTFENPPDGDLGLAIACRQSLLSTYLFYQTLAYLGNQIGPAMATLQRGDPQMRQQIGSIGKALGGIDVLLEDSAGSWSTVATIHETGPLATDIRVVPLPRAGGDSLRVKLALNRGHWRLDCLALVELAGPAQVDTVTPSLVRSHDRLDSAALALLLDPDQYLVTFPGDEYELIYDLPGEAAEYELFLQSRGYYLEWIRNEWVAEENLPRAAQMLLDPAQALRALAPEYKAVEGELEAMFWNSRYANPQE